VGSLTYLYVAFQAVAGRLTLGDLTLYTQAATSVQGSVQGILTGFGSMYENQLYLNDLFDLLRTPFGIEAVDQTADAARRLAPSPTADGEVVFDGVTFTYPGSGREALHDLSLRIEPGVPVSVFGRDGARKSTPSRPLG